ncbi:MAG: hypothetical protein J6B87_04150 [Clostridia bacterium]|nr:hypothetical protein [Clostridia bacterium]
MIKIKEFKINKTVLLISILRKYNEYLKSKENKDYECSERYKRAEHLSDRVNEVFKSNPKCARLLREVCDDFTNNPDRYKEFLNIPDMIGLLDSVFASEEFSNLYKETQEYREDLMKRCLKFEPDIRRYFSENLGIEAEKEIIVNVAHPDFNTGTNNMKNEIFLGHYKAKNSPSYDVVYMMHEIMHCMFPYQSNWNKKQIAICHSLIELATDNELKSLLEGNIQNYSQGHEDANLQRNKLLPLWCAFLGKSEDEIKDLRNIKGADFSNYSELLKSETISKINFSNLMEHCVKNYRYYGVSYKEKEEVEF